MNFIKNKVKSQVTKGIFIASGSEFIVEIAANSGFDWLILDLEHGVTDEKDILKMMSGMHSYQTASIVRIPQLRIEYVKRMLDFGASGIMCPMIETPQDAKDLADFMRYPPEGKRGLGGGTRASNFGCNFKEYFQEANKNLLCIAQIETKQAVENIEEIAQVDGIDVLFIGHSDLSLNLGCFQEYDHPEIIEAENKVLKQAVKYGKVMGMHLKASMNQEEYIKKGFSLMAIGSDTACLRSGFKKMLENCEIRK